MAGTKVFHPLTPRTVPWAPLVILMVIFWSSSSGVPWEGWLLRLSPLVAVSPGSLPLVLQPNEGLVQAAVHYVTEECALISPRGKCQ